MLDNIVTKPLGLVLIVTAHIVYSNGPRKEEFTRITGILSSNITLTFTFSDTKINNNSHFGVYRDKKKVSECLSGCPGNAVFEVYPKTTSVLYHIANLTRNHTGEYFTSLFVSSNPPKESAKVWLDVRVENRSSTVPPMPTNSTKIEASGSSSFLSFHIVTVLVVSPVVLLAAVLPWLIWCLVRTKDKEQQPPQSSNPTLQETIEPDSVPPPSVIYSVLDFPKRPSAILEINPNDTEYAAVSYLPEKRQM